MHAFRISLIAIFCFSPFLIKAQQRQVNIEVGDTLLISTCKKGAKSFESMDLFVKTRIIDTSLTFNYETGDDFYDWYFGTGGDFDSRRLPCTFGGRKFRVMALNEFPNDDGTNRMVILGQLDNERTVIWVELNKAVELRELIL